MYIFDLEGTLSDSKHREHLLPDKNNPKQERSYDAFHGEFPKDKVKLHNKVLMQNCMLTSKTIILTGMMEKHQGKVLKWLLENGIAYDGLVMRANDDYSSSPNFKLNWIKGCGEIIHMVFDDREDVVVQLLCHGIPAIVVK